MSLTPKEIFLLLVAAVATASVVWWIIYFTDTWLAEDLLDGEDDD